MYYIIYCKYVANCPAAFLSYFHYGFVMKYSWQMQRSQWAIQVGWVGQFTRPLPTRHCIMGTSPQAFMEAGKKKTACNLSFPSRHITRFYETEYSHCPPHHMYFLSAVSKPLSTSPPGQGTKQPMVDVSRLQIERRNRRRHPKYPTRWIWTIEF